MKKGVKKRKKKMQTQTELNKMEEKKQMVRLKCQRPECGYEWDYEGKSEWYTSCPRCHTSVKVKQDNGSSEEKK